ncbi:MAG TPA: VOC family protein [Micromonosporaceae bacterium]
MSGFARFYGVVLECQDPRALAEFYSALTGWELEYADDEWVTLRDGDNVRLSFQKAPGHIAPNWPDAASPMQVHLDFYVDDLTKSVDHAIALGATRFDHQPGESFTVLADPAGHPFCLCV